MNRIELSRGALSIVAGFVATTLTFNTTIVAAAHGAGMVATVQVGQFVPGGATQQATGTPVAQTADAVLDEFAESTAWTADVYAALFGETLDAGALQLQGFAGHDGVFLGDLNGSAFVADIELLEEGREQGPLVLYPAYGTLRTGASTVESYLFVFMSTEVDTQTFIMPATEGAIGMVVHYIDGAAAGLLGGGNQGIAQANNARPSECRYQSRDCERLFPGEDCLSLKNRAYCNAEETRKQLVCEAAEDRELALARAWSDVVGCIGGTCAAGTATALIGCWMSCETPACIPGCVFAAGVAAGCAISATIICGYTFFIAKSRAWEDFENKKRRALEGERTQKQAADRAFERCQGLPRPRVAPPLKADIVPLP